MRHQAFHPSDDARIPLSWEGVNRKWVVERVRHAALWVSHLDAPSCEVMVNLNLVAFGTFHCRVSSLIRCDTYQGQRICPGRLWSAHRLKEQIGSDTVKLLIHTRRKILFQSVIISEDKAPDRSSGYAFPSIAVERHDLPHYRSYGNPRGTSNQQVVPQCKRSKLYTRYGNRRKLREYLSVPRNDYSGSRTLPDRICRASAIGEIEPDRGSRQQLHSLSRYNHLPIHSVKSQHRSIAQPHQLNNVFTTRTQQPLLCRWKGRGRYRRWNRHRTNDRDDVCGQWC